MEVMADKILFLLTKAKEHNCDENEYKRIVSYTNEHSNHLVLGKFFGFSVSDYAIATLKWIGKKETISKYEEIFERLDEIRKREISKLVKMKYYEQL